MPARNPALLIEKLSAFLNTPLDVILRERLACDPWEKALNLFQSAAATVPAYRHFLDERGVNSEHVQRFEEFHNLPLMDKANYMQVYPLPLRCRNGNLSACDRMAVSSGSTGISTFWPRAMTDELDTVLRFEQAFRHAFRAHERATLAIVCFPLGNWVGGMFTASCLRHLASKGYPLTVATPGNKPDEILRVVRELGPHFEQTVLLGYPPFVKDVMDSGLASGLDWRPYKIRFVFAGEAFSEEWRELMHERAGASDPCHASASLYGTADGGVLANETPVSVAIRRFLARTPAAARELFGEPRLPTLAQYDPTSRFFELVDGKTLAVTADNGVPLIRYHIADRGGLMDWQGMMAFLEDHGAPDLADYGLAPDASPPPLPFVWVFGRADFTVSFYGANIFPENVTAGLEQPETRGWVTGKFVMETRHDAEGSEYLFLAIELAPEETATPERANLIASSVRAQLLRLNSEFAHYAPAHRQTPTVELRNFGDAEYFPAGVKHRYTRRSKQES
jgi:phenylacetate-CoA ligase